jgi:hypothetical protein
MSDEAIRARAILFEPAAFDPSRHRAVTYALCCSTDRRFGPVSAQAQMSEEVSSSQTAQMKISYLLAIASLVALQLPNNIKRAKKLLGRIAVVSPGHRALTQYRAVARTK